MGKSIAIKASDVIDGSMIPTLLGAVDIRNIIGFNFDFKRMFDISETINAIIKPITERVNQIIESMRAHIENVSKAIMTGLPTLAASQLNAFATIGKTFSMPEFNFAVPDLSLEPIMIEDVEEIEEEDQSDAELAFHLKDITQEVVGTHKQGKLKADVLVQLLTLLSAAAVRNLERRWK